METLTYVLILSQLFFLIIAGTYFFMNLKGQSNSSDFISSDSKKELEKMNRLREIKLTKPLTEKTRPETLAEIVGQENGIKALKSAICGPNPQHVIIYGPPGVGKTAAARIILREAIKGGKSPFGENAPFVELDATILQFDERSIADPLMGSVHDPIYHGAGNYGQAGVPQPKPGAVTEAHGGILFIDEIGELHNTQMNKLLKVLEDRKVTLHSSYYSKSNKNIPKHIHDIFQNGLPADFRLIGATTKSPDEIPPALRSRCTEIHFKPLKSSQVMKIAENAVGKSNLTAEDGVYSLISEYCENGRDSVNIVQAASAISILAERKMILLSDVEEIIEENMYPPVFTGKVPDEKRVGIVSALVVNNSGKGAVIEIEAVATPNKTGVCEVCVSGVADEEEINKRNGKLKRKSQIRSSVDNVLTALRSNKNFDINNYNIHLNFSSPVIVDGPSAGAAIYCAIFSAVTENFIDSKIAITGEISIKGKINAVGGVGAKISAAKDWGINMVFIPAQNWKESYSGLDVNIIQVEKIGQILGELFGGNRINVEDSGISVII